jgi:hypothetical protein
MEQAKVQIPENKSKSGKIDQFKVEPFLRKKLKRRI